MTGVQTCALPICPVSLFNLHTNGYRNAYKNRSTEQMLHFLIDYMADDSFSIVNSMHDDFFSSVMMSVKEEEKRG